MPSSLWQSPLVLFLRSALWTILFPGIIAVYIPWRFFGVRYASVEGIGGVIGWLLVLIGAVLLLASIVEFARRGKGTLSPVDPPKRLVVSGPYRWVRNPMYAGVVFMLVGQSLFTSGLGLVVYVAVLFGIVDVFITLHEEPYLEHMFGDSFREYKRNVRRWMPRIRPWRQPDSV